MPIINQAHWEVIVVGGGFSGLEVVKQLAGSGIDTLIIDRNSYHLFVPLLYQVATGYIRGSAIAYPFTSIVKNMKNIHYRQGEVSNIDFANKTLTVNGSTLSYQNIVLATGSSADFSGVPGTTKHVLPLRTLCDAEKIHERVIESWNEMYGSKNGFNRRSNLRFVVVGGGATGVELAGSLIEFFEVLNKQYGIASSQAKSEVVLLHSGNSILTDYPNRLRRRAMMKLLRRGIRINLQAKVNKVDKESVWFLRNGRQEWINAHTVIWTAGVEASVPRIQQQTQRGRAKKLIVQPTFQLKQYDSAYVIGDACVMTADNIPMLGIAPEAIQHGIWVGKNLLRKHTGRHQKSFQYFNKGSAAVCMRYTGIACLFGSIEIGGLPAWLLWLCIHWWYLPGWSNKRIVLHGWLRDIFFQVRITF